MTDALTTTTPAERFRAKATGMLINLAEMTLHQLVDEFQSLTLFMEGSVTESDHGPALNPDGQLASRERKLVSAAARARFGITFEAYDRSNPEDSGW